MSFPTWPDLAKRLPSAVEPSAPSVYDAVTTDAASLSGKTVLYRDQQGWCPYIERLWLALEVKNADYVTVLVDEDFTMPPGCDTAAEDDYSAPPRIRWRDGTIDDASDWLATFKRLEVEFPNEPCFFPDGISVSVDLVGDSFDRFHGIMPRFIKPNSLAPYVFPFKIQRQGSFDLSDPEPGEVLPKYKYQGADTGVLATCCPCVPSPLMSYAFDSSPLTSSLIDHLPVHSHLGGGG